MGIDELLGVHAVDVVRAEDTDVVGLLVADQVQVLEDGVRRTLEPALTMRICAGTLITKLSNKGDMRHVSAMWRSRLWLLYWVSTAIRR